MDDTQRYITYVRGRITDLRTQKDVSEHRMSLELGKSGSYIRGITSGAALPSLRELFNIMAYLEVPTLRIFLRQRKEQFPGLLPDPVEEG